MRLIAGDSPGKNQNKSPPQSLTPSLGGSPKLIVASQYGDTTGAPALFDAHHFDGLCDLSGDCGAKRIIAAHHERVGLVRFDGGEIDLDTPDDVANYQSQACRDNR